MIAGWVVALACLAGTAAGFEIWRREHGRRPSTVAEGVEPEAAPEMSDDDDRPPTCQPARPTQLALPKESPPMMSRIARTAGIMAVLLALDYLLLVGIGLFLTKVLGNDSSLIRWEDNVNDGLADGRTPTDERRHLRPVRPRQHRRHHRRSASSSRSASCRRRRSGGRRSSWSSRSPGRRWSSSSSP